MLDTAAIRGIFGRIDDGHNNHGSFLRTFARAYLLADRDNQDLLDRAARGLILKYKLESYADEASNKE